MLLSLSTESDPNLPPPLLTLLTHNGSANIKWSAVPGPGLISGHVTSLRMFCLPAIMASHYLLSSSSCSALVITRQWVSCSRLGIGIKFTTYFELLIPVMSWGRAKSLSQWSPGDYCVNICIPASDGGNEGWRDESRAGISPRASDPRDQFLCSLISSHHG